MKQSYQALLVIILVGIIGLSSFHCGSPHLTRANLYIQEQQWDEAMSELEAELEENPENAEAWYLKGRVLSEMGEFDGMGEAFDRSLAISDEFKEDILDFRFYYWVEYLNAGIEEYQRGQEDPEYYRDAIELFKIATKMEPDSTLAYKNWGYAHLILGELEEALVPFIEVLERENDPEIAKFTGQIYFDRGYELWRMHGPIDEMDAGRRERLEDYLEESIHYLMMSLEEDPDDGEVVATLSNAFIILERQEEAMEIFRRGIETDPFNKIYHYNLGVLILEEDRFEEAIEHFQNALDLDPDYEDAHFNIGVAYVNWGVELRERAVAERDEEDKRYLEKFEQALPHLERVTNVRPNDAGLWETLGRLYANLDRVEEAEAAFERADRLEEGR